MEDVNIGSPPDTCSDRTGRIVKTIIRINVRGMIRGPFMICLQITPETELQ
jgi:hypothetical protein